LASFGTVAEAGANNCRSKVDVLPYYLVIYYLSLSFAIGHFESGLSDVSEATYFLQNYNF